MSGVTEHLSNMAGLVLRAALLMLVWFMPLFLELLGVSASCQFTSTRNMLEKTSLLSYRETVLANYCLLLTSLCTLLVPGDKPPVSRGSLGQLSRKPARRCIQELDGNNNAARLCGYRPVSRRFFLARYGDGWRVRGVSGVLGFAQNCPAGGVGVFRRRAVLPQSQSRQKSTTWTGYPTESPTQCGSDFPDGLNS